MSLLIKGFKEKAFAASSYLDGNFWKIHLNSKGEKVNATREGWAKLITFFKSLISYSNHREPNYFPPFFHRHVVRFLWFHVLLDRNS